MFKKLFLGGILVFMVGCASLPETLKTQTESPITDLAVIIDDPDGAQGEEVRLGGIIAAVKNEKTRTRLEIASLPLTSDGRPRIDAKPIGRFVAYVPGFLEPLEYAPDRLVTVAGRLTGKEDGQVGEFDYVFPVVDVAGHQIWRVKQEIRIDDFDSYHSCLGSRCSYFGFGTTRGEVYHRVTK
ncbi:starvation-inducible protein [Photobacterium jeanii]|uniref:Starvation-inducible protein n=1 Tax=Photobacterium jeanii TaxID=858640 RepID=A0A178KMY4_9GAMM|nr:Slp family lipoprotein [Photobacterium jeanii]OAN18476.1 starvation-inducible protein [Photobacterium jeanii]PST91842.1 starvation-inducible protein [Photobacterium jeanii]